MHANACIAAGAARARRFQASGVGLGRTEHTFLGERRELVERLILAVGDGVLPAKVRRIHEENPMLGLRGVRLGLVIPGLFAMQVQAVAEAPAARDAAEIMVPLFGATCGPAVIAGALPAVLCRSWGR